MLTYIFWPNPPAPSYSNPKVMALLLAGFALVAVSFALKRWRKNQQSPITRKLSASWPGATLWFGLTALFLTVCRVEGISYLSMRLWWLVWAVAAVFYILFQFKMYKMRNYEVLPKEQEKEDPRDKYLPKKKR